MKTRLAVHLVSSLVALASLSLLAPQESLACSGGDCYGGALLPATDGVIPSSTPAIIWSPRRGAGAEPTASDIGLFEVTDTGENPVAVDIAPLDITGAFIVTPKTPLLPGADYVVRGKNFCDATAPDTESTFGTSDAAPLPATLGTLSITGTLGQLEVETSSGECSTMIEATQVHVNLTLSAEALPFADAFFYQTLVDGEQWVRTNSLTQERPLGASWVGRGKDLLYTRCNAPLAGDLSDGIPAGTHKVSILATLPGSSFFVKSDEIDVELKCPPVDSVDTPPVDDYTTTNTCSFAPGGFGKANGFFVAIPALLFALALRRRRTDRS